MRWALVIAVVVGGFACGTANPFERGDERGATDAGGGVSQVGGDAGATDGGVVVDAGSPVAALSFATSIEPIFQSKCASCHAVFGGAFRVTGGATTDYANTLLFVNAGSPTLSYIVRKPTGQEYHGGGTNFQTDSTEYATLLQWISDGTKP